MSQQVQCAKQPVEYGTFILAQAQYTTNGRRVLVSPVSLLRRPANPPPAPLAAPRGCVIIWFRANLRLHDHEPLSAANADSLSLLPVFVFVFDPRDFGRPLHPGCWLRPHQPSLTPSPTSVTGCVGAGPILWCVSAAPSQCCRSSRARLAPMRSMRTGSICFRRPRYRHNNYSSFQLPKKMR
ncbi:hypothetical protein Cni_G18927 [Canna indica]|uniref:Photolyase/cryptochrome alpha/beta domain-containing protein n=1 Tax=Canna indica TaxID=4628 RepID=A0AAQ3KJR1_9LILI|nr:hypothetical protein Cni_G18927 [Canna indica]